MEQMPSMSSWSRLRFFVSQGGALAYIVVSAYRCSAGGWSSPSKCPTSWVKEFLMSMLNDANPWGSLGKASSVAELLRQAR